MPQSEAQAALAEQQADDAAAAKKKQNVDLGGSANSLENSAARLKESQATLGSKVGYK